MHVFSMKMSIPIEVKLYRSGITSMWQNISSNTWNICLSPTKAWPCCWALTLEWNISLQNVTVKSRKAKRAVPIHATSIPNEIVLRYINFIIINKIRVLSVTFPSGYVVAFKKEIIYFYTTPKELVHLHCITFWFTLTKMWQFSGNTNDEKQINVIYGYLKQPVTTVTFSCALRGPRR